MEAVVEATDRLLAGEGGSSSKMSSSLRSGTVIGLVSDLVLTTLLVVLQIINAGVTS